MSKSRIFLSSVQKELSPERRAVKDYVHGDPLLRRFFDVFLFEDLPASDRRADEVYLDEVVRSPVYVGLFGQEYGFEDASGVSPTEREFDCATSAGKARLIFVKGADDQGRHPKMVQLIRKAGAQLIRRRFTGITDLNAALYASLVEHLERTGAIQTRPFDERPCPDAVIADLAAPAVAQFVRLARSERQFPLPVETPVAAVLAHLHLLHEGRPTNAAMLLFGREPQRFLPCAEIRCMHFHGTEIQRPVPFYRVFKGTLFEQVDLALDFVLSKLNRSVGTRAESVQAPVRYEIPPGVVREAIVNAVAHRDYTSPGAVQASRELDDLVRKGVFAKVGTTGRGTNYCLTRKGDIKGTTDASAGPLTKGDTKGTKGTFTAKPKRARNTPNASTSRLGGKKAIRPNIRRNANRTTMIPAARKTKLAKGHQRGKRGIKP